METEPERLAMRIIAENRNGVLLDIATHIKQNQGKVQVVGISVDDKSDGVADFAKSSSSRRLARRFRKQPEHRENQRFPLEIIGFGVACGAIDLFPHLRQPCKAGKVRVGIGVVAVQAFADPALDALTQRLLRLRDDLALGGSDRAGAFPGQAFA